MWHALESLGDTPYLGRPRDEVVPGYRSLVVEQHVIFYQVSPTQVAVIRILSSRMDARRALRAKS